MSISSELATLVSEKNQREDVISARAMLQNASWIVERTNSDLDTIIASGSFDTIPTTIKNCLNRWRNLLKDLESSIQADSEIVEALNWTE